MTRLCCFNVFFRSGPRLSFLASRLKNSKANGQTILGRDAMALVNLMKLHFESNVASNESFCMEPYGTLHVRKGKQWKTWKSSKLGCNSGPRHRLWTWRIFTLPKRSWSVRSPFWCDAAVTVVLLNCFSLLHQLHPIADEARTTQRMRRTTTICWRAYTDVRCVPFPDVPFQMCLDSYRWKSYKKKLGFAPWLKPSKRTNSLIDWKHLQTILKSKARPSSKAASAQALAPGMSLQKTRVCVAAKKTLLFDVVWKFGSFSWNFKSKPQPKESIPWHTYLIGNYFM